MTQRGCTCVAARDRDVSGVATKVDGGASPVTEAMVFELVRVVEDGIPWVFSGNATGSWLLCPRPCQMHLLPRDRVIRVLLGCQDANRN